MNRKLYIAIIITALASSVLIFQNCNDYKSKAATNRSVSSDYQVVNSQLYSASLSAPTAEEQAVDIYRRLAGITPDRSTHLFKDMVDHINSGRRKQAAELVTTTADFYHITVRDFANKMSTREGNTLAPLSDFVATVIGVVRDDVDAKELLTGNFYYRGRSLASADVKENIVRSNKHYEQLETNNTNLMTDLVKEDGQKIVNNAGNVVIHEDAAGILTSRAFMFAHANAGTNRRIIEYVFKVFECAPIDTWASTSNPDSHIGRDIGRTPLEEFNNKCKGCHTGMDAMRPATAYYDFFVESDANKIGYIKYKFPYTSDSIDGALVTVPADQRYVPTKFRRASDAFEFGYVVKDDSWVNYADGEAFGWNTPVEGQGMADLGEMIANSNGFRQCLVKRVFASVCKYELTQENSPLIRKLADDFKYNGFKLKDLFVSAALRPECLGVDNE